jgi:hypothetical protein
MCKPLFSRKGIKKLPSPANTPPRLKNPWEADINFCLSSFSISVTRVFIEISVKPLVAPNKKSAVARLRKPGASRGNRAAIQLRINPMKVALPTPILLMIFDAIGKIVKTPSERKKIAIPRVALLIPRSSFTDGI